MFDARKLRKSNQGYRPKFQKSRSLFRPRLEVLEDRCLPSTVNTWVAASGLPSPGSTCRMGFMFSW
jgi:hypothetical protein